MTFPSTLTCNACVHDLSCHLDEGPGRFACIGDTDSGTSPCVVLARRSVSVLTVVLSSQLPNPGWGACQSEMCFCDDAQENPST